MTHKFKMFRASPAAWLSRWSLFFLLLSWTTAHAHLIDAQKGSLSLKTDRAYLAMSIPVSGLNGVDDDGDGLLSSTEFHAHLPAIETQIRNGIGLSSETRPLHFNDLMIQLSLSSDKPAPERQLLVMGRFPLTSADQDLRFQLHLFGHQADEMRQYITVTRGEETQLLTLTPENPQRDVLPSLLNVLQTQIQLGIEHILEGTDHLLFLLVVLAAETSLWAIVSVLTAFTVGHAVTLLICNALAWTAPPALVEPAIAATIVLIALKELFRQGAQHKHSLLQRAMLVFACAIVHGLGLADAFTDLGLTGTGKLTSLAGFNVGIEIGQLVVALLGVVFFQLLSKWFGSDAVGRIKKYFLGFAVILGVWWFWQRIDGFKLGMVTLPTVNATT
jgi:hypothetical protein